MMKNKSSVLRRCYTAVFLIVCMLSATAMTACDQNNTLSFSGTIESTQIDINSEVMGKVISVAKDEGAQIEANEAVVVLDSKAQELTVAQSKAALDNARAKLDELKAGSRAEQIRQYEAQVKSAKAKLDELKSGTREEDIRQARAAYTQAQSTADTSARNLAYVKDQYEKTKALFEQGGASQQQVDDMQNKVDSAAMSFTSAQQQLDSAKAKLDLLQNGATAETIRAAEGSYEQAQAQLDLAKSGSTGQAIAAAEAVVQQYQAAYDQALLTLSKFNIRSPIKGTFIYKNANIGDMVAQGGNVGTVSDLNDLWVVIYVPQRNISLIKMNQEVNLTALSLSGTTIHGKISYISDKAEFTPRNTETPEAKENTVFKVKVRITDNIDKLKPGMTAYVVLPSK